MTYHVSGGIVDVILAHALFLKQLLLVQCLFWWWLSDAVCVETKGRLSPGSAQLRDAEVQAERQPELGEQLPQGGTEAGSG